MKAEVFPLLSDVLDRDVSLADSVSPVMDGCVSATLFDALLPP